MPILLLPTIPALRLGIEYDGENWHNSGRNDLKKDLLCLENGVSLMHIREPNCPPIVGVECYVLPDRKESSLNGAIEYIYETLSEEYKATIPKEIKIDVAANRTEIYELMELGRKSNSLEITHPDLASEWHPIRNGNMTPDKVTRGSDKKVWWQCKNGHVWEASVSHRVSGRGCPVCAGKHILVGFNDLPTLYPELMEEWDWEKNEDVVIEKIRKTSSQQVWWKCSKGHSWQAAVYTRVNGRGCPICSGRTVLSGFNDFATICPEITKEWHPTKNVLLPSELAPKSHKKVWWRCEKGHEWEAAINKRAEGTGCPICSKENRKKHKSF